jgi:hypothetical protein
MCALRVKLAIAEAMLNEKYKLYNNLAQTKAFKVLLKNN